MINLVNYDYVEVHCSRVGREFVESRSVGIEIVGELNSLEEVLSTLIEESDNAGSKGLNHEPSTLFKKHSMTADYLSSLSYFRKLYTHLSQYRKLDTASTSHCP